MYGYIYIYIYIYLDMCMNIYICMYFVCIYMYLYMLDNKVQVSCLLVIFPEAIFPSLENIKLFYT